MFDDAYHSPKPPDDGKRVIHKEIHKLSTAAQLSRELQAVDLEARGIACSDCGVKTLPEDFPLKANREPRSYCKRCLQHRRDTSRAKREGFESVEELREFYRKKQADYQASRSRSGKRRYRTGSGSEWTPPPPPSPEEALRLRCVGDCRAYLEEHLKPYKLMSELLANAVSVNACSSSTFADVLAEAWWTIQDAAPYGLSVSTRKRWLGSWTFEQNRTYRGFKPVRTASLANSAAQPPTLDNAEPLRVNPEGGSCATAVD